MRAARAARRASSGRSRRRRGADAAVVVIGLDGDWETEGRDRDDLDLPGRQVELVRAVAAAQPRTVVVVRGRRRRSTCRGPTTCPARAVVLVPRPGGRPRPSPTCSPAPSSPAAGCPCTMPPPPRGHAGLPRHAAGPGRAPLPGGRVLRPPLVRRPRHRAGLPVRPRPRLHDLRRSARRSWPRRAGRRRATTSWSRCRSPTPATGAGSEVVQLYVGDDAASVRRAPRELRGFAKVRARRRREHRRPLRARRHASSRSGTPGAAAGGPRPARSPCGPAARPATSPSPCRRAHRPLDRPASAP